MAEAIEHELCGNCKKEIPQYNYLMHTAHCARNISLCPICKEPIAKNALDAHKQQQHAPTTSKQSMSTPSSVANANANTNANSGNNARTHNRIEANASDSSNVANATANAARKHVNNRIEANAYVTPSKDSLLPCKFCDLELPKLDLEDHENYCGARTDKCIECGELVMFKYKKLHEDSNHGFIKLTDEPGPRPSWDSNTQRTAATSEADSEYTRRRSRLPPLRPFDMSSLYNMADYIPPSTTNRYTAADNGTKAAKQESYKDMSRRLDCKTEYIRNLLHDSASITVPLRSGGTVPRNHFNHSKGKAPQPPLRRRNPPSALEVPCEFCETPIPHEELIEHEASCRPDSARFSARRRSPELDGFFVAQQPSSPEVDLPCEFCCDMIPASQLLRHQATCN